MSYVSVSLNDQSAVITTRGQRGNRVTRESIRWRSLVLVKEYCLAVITGLLKVKSQWEHGA